ncbi:MAG: DUF3604 domain-containing protein [Deltaproteobacteria bacterium]|nr:MAG: DUF3604 domain-containing protein [Deltaproteobacteria bacterium]
MRILARLALGLLLLLFLLGLFVFAAGRGWLGRHEGPGEVVTTPVPAEAIARRTATQLRAARARGVAEPKQILFGDLHVHTTFSMDALLTSLPMLGGTGAHPPADACDFARYCSGLDFWSINDHAEALTPRHWRETVESIRQCNAAAGDGDDPDLVSYLGWEWSQIGFTPDTHYGHRNVVLLGTRDDEIPKRPIAARAPFTSRAQFFPPRASAVVALVNGARGRDFARRIRETREPADCPDGVPVRELPPDCIESVVTPDALFAKLRDWGFPSIVIPHGTTWGLYTPPGSSYAKQLRGHDPELQNLVEIYSGHGNSEEYRNWRAADLDADGRPTCPEPGPGYTPSCWKAGELVRARCLEVGEPEAECARRAADARRIYLEAGLAGWRTLPGHAAADWLDAGQCTDCFQPAFNYRPAGSVQYMLAIRSFEDPANPKRFKPGFIGSSDNHTARPGTGYKELGRGEMTEGMGRKPGPGVPGFLRPEAATPAAAAVPLDPATSSVRGLALFEAERGTGYFLTGGLVAVHAEGRSREAIWSAIQRQEVYATSGPRILLWFEMLGDDGAASALPMGATTVRADTPRFRVRAVGSLEQKSGCPDYSLTALGAERLDALCLGECYHPSDRRRLITRIEVVRIRPQNRPDEPLSELIEDPWRVHACPPDPGGCAFEFEDPEHALAQRDSVYYVRAIEAPSRAIHADPLRCRYDASGACVEVSLCNSTTPFEDDCLDDTEPRAWSSPIFVDYAPLR